MSESHQPVVNMVCCTRCGLCVEACPCHAVQLTENELVFSCSEQCHRGETEGQDCGGWCLCEEACPNGAIDCTFDIVLDASCMLPEDPAVQPNDPAEEPGPPPGESAS